MSIFFIASLIVYPKKDKPFLVEMACAEVGSGFEPL